LSFKVYIPARFAATRLPGKPLLDIAGKPLIQHVWERACDSGASEVVIAADDERIVRAAQLFGATVCLTSPELASGTDRIAAAVKDRAEAPDTVIVNLQGDEPLMPAAVIRQVAERAGDDDCHIATVCEPLCEEQVFDPNVVKVVCDRNHYALYFSRAPIPWDRNAFNACVEGQAVPNLQHYRRHVGIYGYTADYLARFVALPAAEIEQIELLEQLRALAQGARIAVPDAVADCGTGVDTPADLARVRASGMLSERGR